MPMWLSISVSAFRKNTEKVYLSLFFSILFGLIRLGRLVCS